jgi:hypothetical protein
MLCEKRIILSVFYVFPKWDKFEIQPIIKILYLYSGFMEKKYGFSKFNQN